MHRSASGQPSQLELAYRATHYLVEAPVGRLTIRIDQPHPELDSWLTDLGCHCWAYLTAHNPGSVLLSAAENRQRQAALEEEVKEAGWRFCTGEGIGIGGDWPAETSLLILDVKREQAIALAQRFGQAALLFGEVGQPAQLIWTT